jgi:ubiquinone/menaquinone biosynthesis C-methylase UbiE
MTEAARIQREYARREAEIPAGFYDLARPANYFAHCQLARRIAALLDHAGLLPLEGRKIADVGCGTGNWLLEFIQWGARPEDLFGIDLNPSRIEQARVKIPGARFEASDASQLSPEAGSFDLVCQFTAFSSVLDDSMRRSMASEMIRILKPGGAIISYDLRVGNPHNSAVAPISKEAAQRLFPDCRIDVERVTLAPPLARIVAAHSWLLASFLERIPFLRSHNLMLIRKTA